jgi:hypothetical protein
MYLVRVLVRNAGYAQAMWCRNASKPWHMFQVKNLLEAIVTQESLSWIATIDWFANMVAPDSDCDFKAGVSDLAGHQAIYRFADPFTGNAVNISRADYGNINFGFIGAALGM